MSNSNPVPLPATISNVTTPSDSSMSTTAPLHQAPIIMNDVFDEPNTHLNGDDAPAEPPNLSPLYRKGTEARNIFDAKHQVVIDVNFKINVDQEVTVDIETSNVSSRKRKATTVNVIDSKVFNEAGIRQLKQCLYGLSFKEFRVLCAGICDDYSAGMKQIVLSPDVASTLIWKTTVGGRKFELHNYTQWFDFVNLVSQPKKGKASLTILSRSASVVAAQDARVNAARALIANANGSMGKEMELAAMSKELQASKDLITLHELTATIFRMYCERGNASGDSAILVVPWNPGFCYRFTLNHAVIWAKEVRNGLTTIHMPPNTAEYRAEIAKSRVIHPATPVNVRTQLHHEHHALNGGDGNPPPPPPGASLPIKGFGGKDPIDRSGSPIKQSVFSQPPPIKQNPAFVAKVFGGSQEGKSKPGLANQGTSHNGATFDAEGHFDMLAPQSDDIEIVQACAKASEAHEEIKSHMVQLDEFLLECGIFPTDIQTRMGLELAEVQCWSDLIPCHQMTQTTLIEHGIDRQIAARLLNTALERHLQ